jgi:hypothetical protein
MGEVKPRLEGVSQLHRDLQCILCVLRNPGPGRYRTPRHALPFSLETGELK